MKRRQEKVIIDDLQEVKDDTVRLCKTVFLWLSLIIVLLEVIFVVDKENLLAVNDSIQFMGIYLFELIPLSYYMQIRKIERKLAKAERESRN